MQTIISGAGAYTAIGRILRENGCRKFLLVRDASFRFLPIRDSFDGLGFPFAVFDGFTSNPLWEDVRRGIELFRAEGCDTIVAVGGGSAIDVAKCIKLLCRTAPEENALHGEYRDSGVCLIALPTTAGTGSESTRFAVVYENGRKQSVTHDSILPQYAILEPSVLGTLPLYQKTCTLLDALCQGIESFWSLHSTEESRGYAERAIRTIVADMDTYLTGSDPGAAERIQLAANLSGRAINISQTTAPHAMSYKLTSLYRLPHGHAVALCLPFVWEYMTRHPERTSDPRGEAYQKGIFSAVAAALGCPTPEDAIAFLRRLLSRLGISAPAAHTGEDIATLTASVNPDRLRNNPVRLPEPVLRSLYEAILA